MDRVGVDIEARLFAIERSLSQLTAMFLMCTSDPKTNMATFAADAADSLHVAAKEMPHSSALLDAVAQRVEMHWDHVALELASLMGTTHTGRHHYQDHALPGWRATCVGEGD